MSVDPFRPGPHHLKLKKPLRTGVFAFLDLYASYNNHQRALLLPNRRRIHPNIKQSQMIWQRVVQNRLDNIRRKHRQIHHSTNVTIIDALLGSNLSPRSWP